MAPNLAKYTLKVIHNMISSGELTTSQLAEAAGVFSGGFMGAVWRIPPSGGFLLMDSSY